MSKSEPKLYEAFVEVTLRFPIETYHDSPGMVEFWLDGSSSCFDNVIDTLQERHEAQTIYPHGDGGYSEGPCFCGYVVKAKCLSLKETENKVEVEEPKDV